MRKKSKLVYGVGINDADYSVQKFETLGYTAEGKQIRKQVWICPFYDKWVGMIERCYSEKYKLRYPTYLLCTAAPEWDYFMTFRAWMEKQDWKGKELDKDILFPGNKIYSPDTCCFVDSKLNKFLLEATASRGECPIGVYLRKDNGKYRARCNDVVSGKKISLGQYNSPEEAHEAWLAFKLEQAYILAAEQTDPRVAKALIERYENYGNLD